MNGYIEASCFGGFRVKGLGLKGLGLGRPDKTSTYCYSQVHTSAYGLKGFL